MSEPWFQTLLSKWNCRYSWGWMIGPYFRQIATRLLSSWSFPCLTFQSFDWALFPWIPPMIWRTFYISILRSSGHKVHPRCFWPSPRSGCTILPWFWSHPTPFFRFGWSHEAMIFASGICLTMNFTEDFAIFGRDGLPFLYTCLYFFAIRS